MRTLLVFLALQLLAVNVSIAKTIDLFRTVTGSQSQNTALNQTADIVYNANLTALRVGDELSVNYPGSEPFSMKVDLSIPHSNGDVTYVSGDGMSEHAMHITVNNKGALGYMRTAEGRFKLTFENGEFKVLPPSVMNNMKVPSNQGDTVLSPLAKAAIAKGAESKKVSNKMVADLDLVAGSSHSDRVTIDVMVMYDSAFRGRLGGNTLTRINQLISVANAALSRSNTNTAISLVHTQETSYTTRTSTLDALFDLQAGVGPLSIVANLRREKKADLVILLRDFDFSRTNFCGFAFLLGVGQGEIGRGEKDFGVSVVEDGRSQGFFCLDSTLAHEIGHNLGSRHDRNNNNNIGVFPFSHGYDQTGRFFTVMSQNFNGTEIQRFSNPRIQCAGVPCGIDAAASNSADNALSISLVSSGIRNFFRGPNDPAVVTSGPLMLLLDD